MVVRLVKKRMSRDQVHLDTDVYTLACERTAHVMSTFDTLLWAFSGGKDSTAVLQIGLEVAHSDPAFARHLPLKVVHFDEEAIPVQTEEYVRRIAQRDDIDLTWYCLPVKHRNACARKSPWWWPWAPEDRDRWCRPLPPEAVTTLDGFPTDPPSARLSIPDANGLLAPPSMGNVAMMMGIRAQESLTRLRSLLRNRETNYLIKFDDGTAQGNLWKAYPIYDWRTEDVWTAPALKGWDYNRAYDLMEMAGVPAWAQRCSPAFGEEPLEKLWTYAHCFPDVWARMVNRVPGVGAAARYARTELYGYRDRPSKPDDMSWPDFLLHYVHKFQAKDAAFIADRLKIEIRAHYRKVTNPIAVKTRHPETGVSWHWLLMIAMRGDFKSRKQAGQEFKGEGTPETARTWAKYCTEIGALIEAGQWQALGHPGPPPADPLDLMPAWARQMTQEPS